MIFAKWGTTLKYRVYLRFYLIKIKSVLANFGSEKQVKVKKAYFMTTEIDPFLTDTPTNKTRHHKIRTWYPSW